MNQNVKLSKAISYVVVILAALLFLCIWPAGILKQTYVSKSNEIIAMESDPVNVERNVTQMFVGEGGELSAIDLYVCNDMRGETITFRLYDSSYSEIYNKFYVVKDHASLDNLDYENSGHTGFASTKFVNEELEKKVDKVVGKNLSSEDYTKEEKEKLGNISNITEQEIIAILGG